MFDLDAYLARIGLGGRSSLHELHRAHLSAIPFENLDPHRGIPVSLDPEQIAAKLVSARRGGYCFEQNLLLAQALVALGARVEPMLARVRVGSARDAPRPRTHLLLRVHHEDAAWHADVGFGAGSPPAPLPFGPGGPYELGGWRYRVVEDAGELVLQEQQQDGGWADLYGFVPEPVPLVDIETSNWFTATHPRSPFVTGLNVARHLPDGSRLQLSDWDRLKLIEHRPTGDSERFVERVELPALLERLFDLPGFALDGEGRVIAADRATAGA